ncbi:lamin tail domain-containing protein [Halobacterium zhouii]|uniref:lamin tail domain-containing protein n=1 Tax=Halobacterium zhouii TaxID=2902624 RepID=UPI001E3E2CBF|nr:lamin tail domain-containing protein [Halobacterium zhouii]
MKVAYVDGTVVEADRAVLDKEGVTLQNQVGQQGQSKQEAQTHQTVGFVQYEMLKYIVDGRGDDIKKGQQSSSKQSSKKQSGKKQSSKKQSDKKEAPGESFAIKEAQVNAPGVDDWHKNNEYLVFTNTGEKPLDLTDWEVHNEAGDTYRFPSGFDLEPGATITLHSGSGDDTESDLYWGSDNAVWKNNSDTITVRNGDGNVVLENSYS